MERPIIFSTEMVKAILEGRKTQTRRVIKKAPYVFRNGKEIPVNIDTSSWIKLCPYGQVGDRLWVRETWYQDISGGLVCYKADYPLGDKDWPPANTAGKIKPSLFMPRWASRLTLEITGLRAERLQEITEEDALKEGMKYQDLPYDSAPVWQFKDLWDSLNAKRGYGWETNPWVWVIKFDNIGVRVK